MIEFHTLAQVIAAVKEGKRVYWRTGAYEVKQDQHGKWFVHCTITNDWTPLFWADGVNSYYKAENFFVL